MTVPVPPTVPGAEVMVVALMRPRLVVVIVVNTGAAVDTASRDVAGLMTTTVPSPPAVPGG
jgi:hypothetical protein